MLLRGYTFRLVRPECNHLSEAVSALAALSDDISAALPYLNAVLRKARYNPNGPTLAFGHEGHRVVLRPREAAVSNVQDEGEARRVLDGLVELINGVWAARDRIEPSYRVVRDPGVFQVYRLLPGGNCRACGAPTCLAFAAQLLREEAELSACIPLSSPEHAAKRSQLTALLVASGRSEP